MTDLPSSLGIEAVELVAESGRGVTVRVTGRWRRRRPELRGQAMLVVEGPAGRQRFMAMPEPPSLTGAAPGTWRMSFSVPAELAPSLPGRTFLQLGGVMVPLPIGDVVGAGEAAEEPGPDLGQVESSLADLLEARRARSSELAAESARRRAAELAAQVQGLERDLSEAQAESGRLRTSIAERERRLRLAEQDTHAERALRADLEQELARRTRVARHDLSALHERVAELERELVRMRRAVDEAQHLAAAAEAGRADAERRLAAPEPPAPEPPATEPPATEPPAPEPPARASPRARATRRELELDRSARAAGREVPELRPTERAGDLVALAQEASMAELRSVGAEADEERIAELERELVAARVEGEEQRRRSDRAYSAIELVRGELRQLREASPPRPPAGTVAPPPRSPGAAPGPGPVTAEELTAALARLRERAPVAPAAEETAGPQPMEEDTTAVEAPPAAQARAAGTEASLPALAAVRRPVRPWMGRAFRVLAKQDPSAAGHLLLALLPAQRVADPHPIAYDLVLSDVLSAHVTVDADAARVERDPTPRPLAEVDFQLVGDLASIARLIAAGPLRRRLARLAPGRRLARVRGGRGRLVALDGLVGGRLALRELTAAGVGLDSLLALALAAAMIEPEWTVGERFTIAHREPADPSTDAYLYVRNGRAPLASADTPHGPISTVIVCAPDELLGVLAGSALADEIVGDDRPLSLLLQWLERAQCG